MGGKSLQYMRSPQIKHINDPSESLTSSIRVYKQTGIRRTVMSVGFFIQIAWSIYCWFLGDIKVQREVDGLIIQIFWLKHSNLAVIVDHAPRF